MASRAFLSLLADEQDAALRYSLYLTATLTTTTDKVPVKVCEIGSNGLRIEGAALPRIGRDVIVSCGSRELFGCIVAADAMSREIEFEQTVDEGEILHWLHMSAEEARAATAAARPMVVPPAATNVERLPAALSSGNAERLSPL